MAVYTVCFSGTACSRDEGEQDREWDHKIKAWFGYNTTHWVSKASIYDDYAGYIPVRIHRDISDLSIQKLGGNDASCTVRGVGENDWTHQNDSSDPLLKGPITIPRTSELNEYISSYANGENQRTISKQLSGWAGVALALQGANLAASSGADTYNFIGHSRGAVSAIMAAWFLYAYGGNNGKDFNTKPVNIFAIDPVPGPGEWYGIITQLAPNVANYAGVYAWDHLDWGFSPVIPRPTAAMLGKVSVPVLGRTWDTLADGWQQADPLDGAQPSGVVGQPNNYHLYVSRGKHGTVAGNTTSNGLYDPKDRSENANSVPRLIYKLGRAYLTQWGTTFKKRCRVQNENAKQLRARIHTNHGDYDSMAAGGEFRTSMLPTRQNVRRCSSIMGTAAWDRYYLEDVVGDPPYRLFYPCTSERAGGGWVKWVFL